HDAVTRRAGRLRNDRRIRLPLGVAVTHRSSRRPARCACAPHRSVASHMDLSRYSELFLTKSCEHLSAMNHSLLALESSPEAREPVGAVFRAVHTVKGMSATMGYRAVTDLAHELESVLDRVRRGELAVTADVTELLFEAADALEQAIEGAVQTGVAAADDIAVPDAILDLIARLKARAAVATGGSAPKQVAAPSRAPDPRPSQAATSSRLIRLRLASGTALRGEIVRAMFAVGDVDRVEVDGVETVGQPHQQTAADGQAGSAARPTRQV